MALLVIVTAVDVVGRYFLNSPLTGSSEIIEFILAIGIASAVPLVTERNEHVTVSLIGGALGSRGRAVANRISYAICLATSALLAYQLFDRAHYLWGTGVYTQSLFLPLWPVSVVMAVFWVAATILFARFVYTGSPAPQSSPDQPL
jgi:TRAP-type C4-dicarboxylate transport system permease small subunit